MAVLHWHGDSFDLPGGAQRLASNAHYENQAFAYGRNALGLQFHLEADPRQLEEWYVGHAVELAAAKISVAELRAATSKRANGLAEQANRIFTRWLREITLYILVLTRFLYANRYPLRSKTLWSATSFQPKVKA